MPIARFQMPDGRIARFEVPDGTTPEQAQEMIAQSLPQLEQAPVEPQGERDNTQSNKDRFMQGFLRDPIAGIQQLGAETEIAGFVAPEWAKSKRAEIQRNEAKYQQARKDAGKTGIDWPRLGGQIVNPVNLGIAALTKTPPGASLPTRMVSGGVAGGLMGGTAPVHGEASRAGQAGLGAAGGVLSAPLTGGAARAVNPKVSPEVQLLRKAGVTPTVGQSLGGAAKTVEDKFTSFPIMGDAITSARKKGMEQFQRAAYDRALNQIGAKSGADVGFEGMQRVHAQLSKAYDDLLPKLSFKPDQQFSQQAGQLRAMVPQSERKLYDQIIGKVTTRATPQGNMSGETFKNVESTLGDEIKALLKDGGYEKGKVAEAVMQYRDLMRHGLERANPTHAPQLQAINKGWANYAILRRAASGPQAAQTGTFTPSQLMQGVQESAKRSGQAAGRAKLSEGRALMQDLATAGQNVLPSKYPDSGTAGRIMQNVLVNPIVGVPQALTGATLGAAGSIPYLPGARQGVDLLLNARPQGASALADVIRRYPGLLAPVAPALVNSGQNR